MLLVFTLYTLITLLSSISFCSNIELDNSISSFKLPSMKIKESQKQSQNTIMIKRKRLWKAYAAKQLLEVECSQNDDSRCEICNQVVPIQCALRSPIYPTHRVKTCADCKQTVRKTQIGDRVLLRKPYKKKIEIGQVVSRRDDGKYGVILLDGSQDVTDATKHKYLIKLCHEAMPSEELCQMCCSFKYCEHKCPRENCGQQICDSCFKKVIKCHYCTLLRIGTPVKITRTYPKLTNETKQLLIDQFGRTFYIIYGRIKGILFPHEPNEPQEYYVEISEDYAWNKIDGKYLMSLEEPTYSLIVKENEVEVFTKSRF